MMIRISIITGLMSLVAFQSCTTANAEKEKREDLTKFIVTNPVTMDTSFTKGYVSQIRSVRNIEIHAQEKGFLQNIYVDEGQFVKSGQLLFKIMPN